ncbi:uncharacterized protein [Lolium perenne]|uniref:uncharacterized protein n=1 Tax=Lolium perenne TaxID=4522 RepID=UPI003A98DF7A
MASSSTTPVLHLGNPPTNKLTRSNFPGWRAQVVTAIRGARQLGLLDGTNEAPPETLPVTPADDATDKTPKAVPNPAYDAWICRDQTVLNYLLQSLSSEVLPHVHKIEHAAGIWQALEEMFTSQCEAKVTNLRIVVENTKNLNMTTPAYLTKMQGIVDELAVAGCTVTTLLAGLGAPYNVLVAALGVVMMPITLSHLYAQLNAYEHR